MHQCPETFFKFGAKRVKKMYLCRKTAITKEMSDNLIRQKMYGWPRYIIYDKENEASRNEIRDINMDREGYNTQNVQPP